MCPLGKTFNSKLVRGVTIIREEKYRSAEMELISYGQTK